jgi:hypothetical protein
MKGKQMAEQKYPMCDKLRECRERSQVVGEFIDWLANRGMVICDKREAENKGKASQLVVDTETRFAESLGTEFVAVFNAAVDAGCVYWPTFKSVTKLLEEFFEIDPIALENERRAMLDACRAASKS